MGKITHQKQQEIWEKEHIEPQVLLQMDSQEASSGVTRFWDWLKTKNIGKGLKGIEMGCGKGRNAIWLTKQGVEMTAFDFSPAAIKEAQTRAEQVGAKKVHFLVHDATKSWPFSSSSFDIAIDCFATTDIESSEGRLFAKDELTRVLKPGGYILVYTLSIDDEFHKEMIKVSPAEEKNAFYHPTTGKFEKTFDRNELLELYKDLQLVEEQRIEKTTTFFGKEYACKHFWMIFQK